MDDFEKILQTIAFDGAGVQQQLMSFTAIIPILISVLFGFLIFGVYYYSSSKAKRDLGMCQVIPSLSLLMTILIRMQGGHVAVFFGIFGVLSIVRFRSELTDQKGITFILFGLISGLLVGLGNYVLAALGLLALFIIFFSLRRIVETRNKVSVVIKSDNLQKTSDIIEGFFRDNNIAYSFLTPSLKFDVNKNNILEDFSKLEYFIYYKTDKELVTIYDKLIVIIKENNMQIEIKNIKEQR
ncbi:MAG: DUF4956 domain-containing protein [Spirochaetales bacterium]|nr:DUF4956 domain-containing protein [Spirochaetales bacterium]